VNYEVEHTDVGAYALGLLEERDRRAFEAHLARCRSCAAELGEFAGLHSLLTGVEPSITEQNVPDDLIGMLRRRKAADRNGRNVRVMLGAAAAVILLGGGVTAGIAITGGPAAHQSPGAGANPLGAGERHSATDKVSGATGTVAMESKGWGTKVSLDLGGIRGPLDCELVAVTRTGRKRVVIGWAVPQKGYGVAGSPEHLTVQGGVASPPADIVRFVVKVAGGDDLLTIPV
jgi:hypothetical protein